MGEGQGEKQIGRAVGDDQAGQGPAEGEQDAFDERLRHDVARTGAHGQADRRLCPKRHGSGEEEIGDIRAGDEEHHAADAEQDVQAVPVGRLHHGDAATGRHDVDRLGGQRAHDVRHPVGGIPGVGLDPALEERREARGHPGHRRARAQAADHPEPGRRRFMQKRALAVDHRLLAKRHPQIGRIALDRVPPKKPGAAMPTTVTGWLSMTQIDPTSVRSPPKAVAQT